MPVSKKVKREMSVTSPAVPVAGGEKFKKAKSRPSSGHATSVSVSPPPHSGRSVTSKHRSSVDPSDYEQTPRSGCAGSSSSSIIPLKRSRSASPIRMTECGCGGEEGFEGVCGGCGGERKVVESPVGEEEGEKKEEDEDGDLLKPPVVPSTPGMSIPAVMPPTVHGVPMLPYQSVAQAATRQVRVVQQQQQQQGVAVVRRWERGEPTMLKDLMPVSKKRRWIERYQAVQRVNPLAVRHVDASPPPPPPPIPVPVPTVVPMVVVEMEVETREEEEEEEEVVVEGAPVAGVEDTEMDVKESMSPVPVSAPVTSEDPEVEKEVDEGRGDTVAEDVEMEGEGGVDGDVGEGDVSEGVVEVKSGEDGSYPTPPIEVQRKSVDVGEVRKREEEEVASVDAVQGIE